MKCSCGGIITGQTILVAAKYGVNNSSCCLFCLARQLDISYYTLLDKYRGIDVCRDCTSKNQKEERKRLLGLR